MEKKRKKRAQTRLVKLNTIVHFSFIISTSHKCVLWWLIFNAHSAVKVLSHQNKIQQITNKKKTYSLLMTCVTALSSRKSGSKNKTLCLKRSGGKNKQETNTVKWAGKAKTERQNNWQQAKHVELYSDLHQTYMRKLLIAFIFSAQGI